MSYFQIGWEHQKQEHYEEAVKNYKLASELGSQCAKYHLNCMYYGQGIEYDPTQIVSWKQIHLNDDDIRELLTFYGESEYNSYIQNNIGLLYKIYKDDMEKALLWYNRSAAQNYVLAQTNLGSCYKEIGDCDRARVWYLLAANNGCPMAQCSLGKNYQNGNGVVVDYKEAYKWYLMSANQGYVIAQSNLGYLYLYGLGVEKDYEQALLWFGLAISQNDIVAQCNLGNMYENGWGLEQDYNIAMNIYLLAANKGEPVAYNAIGWLYENGLGVSVNYEEASRWYLLGAEKGNSSAQNNLATLHYDLKIYKDLGSHYNYDQAHKWYSSFDKKVQHYSDLFLWVSCQRKNTIYELGHSYNDFLNLCKF